MAAHGIVPKLEARQDRRYWHQEEHEAGDVPLPGAPLRQPELVGELGEGEGPGQVLLVGEHEHRGLAHPLVLQHSLQLRPGLGHPHRVVTVHHPDDALRVLQPDM